MDIKKTLGLDRMFLTSSESTLILDSMVTVLESESDYTPLKALEHCEKLYFKNKKLKRILSIMRNDIRKEIGRAHV